MNNCENNNKECKKCDRSVPHGNGTEDAPERTNDGCPCNRVEDALMVQVAGAAVFKGPYDKVALLLENLDRMAPEGVTVVYRRYSAGFLKVVAEEETYPLRR